MDTFDIVVIGAGPAGAVSSALLNQKGYRVLVLERQHFPRFSIGESLLPQCMTYLEQAGMLEAVENANFQHKNGAAFCRGDQYEYFDFREKFSDGWGTTFQVQRESFDKILADESAKQGVTFRYGHTLTACNTKGQLSILSVETDSGENYQVQGRFVLDASGFGRVLPKLLNLEKPSTLGTRKSIFTHIKDNIDAPEFDRNKILITVHPQHSDVWFWLIPFSNGRASVGVVIPPALLETMTGSPGECLQQLISEAGKLAEFLKNAEFDTEFRTLGSYSCDVTSLYGENYALLGNAGEFLDPIFSSGVTIALTSASLAAEAVDRQLRGLQPDWEEEYAQKLKVGVKTFKEFVEGWYDERFQDVVFSNQKSGNITRMISSILAGYAWDTKNPYVHNPSRLTTLAQICQND
ncbi:NAD(P)/FAD-dependent oxidoreductase [Aliiglaciecola sp. 3_MG-2023]|uniref:NAD(P)/FAD-dependent oxidoreductase n=1 Tax=Aliiglaciecola sp. 3_MG-2023 TaxID=3062644 RepID=UPI0026E47E28|nr:NAD(P)/FAD-dependent oxidoreductase [Aliiglaciecola sp. 3_MG-2023]MDO6695049.1 NAD(P)/FAD-dependent oxidoreductase [Aliiglaciecola sp. 3_MG-2023]